MFLTSFWGVTVVGEMYKQDDCKQVEQKTNKNTISHFANRTFLHC